MDTSRNHEVRSYTHPTMMYVGIFQRIVIKMVVTRRRGSQGCLYVFSSERAIEDFHDAVISHAFPAPEATA